MIHEHFVCDTYHCNVLFYSACSYEEVHEHMESEYNIKISEYWGDCKGCEFKEVSGNLIIYYGLWIKKRNDFSTLVHEALHLVYHIFKDREIKVSHPNQETVAYYLAYWFDKIRPLMIKRKKEKK